jgi:Ni/Co efflux regulator RcnB
MRKFLFPLLLATSMAATPAFAQQWNKQDRQTAREDRQAAKEDRQAARQERQDSRPAPRAEQPQFQAPQRNFAPQSAPAPERGNFERQQWSRPAETVQPSGRRFDGGNPEQRPWSRPAETVQPGGRRFDGGNPEQRPWSRPAPDVQQAPSGFSDQRNTDSVTNWRSHERDVTRQERYSEEGRQGYSRVAPSYARPDRPAPVPQTAYRYGGRSPQWNTNWRNDRNYDWRRYRDQHRSIFRIGVYYDPFGWGYQRYNIGWRLYPAYYEQNYWLTDPYMYDLPPAPYPLQWVRYYDDALLVNVFTGQVVDVMYDFFW